MAEPRTEEVVIPEYEESGCEYDCGTGETCCGGSCCNDKCWDTHTPISGSISVQNAELCQQVTHTSSISDTDHWIEGGGSEGWPADSITYSWSKTPGTNPQSGTFIGDTNDPSVVWKAPPCTGTVNIKLTANDVPLAMDNPCPGSTRDDSAKDFQGTSAVSLPSGCGYAGPHDSSIHWDDFWDYYWDSSLPGLFLYKEATYDVDFKYSNCAWVCEISNVVAETAVWVRRWDHPDYVSITEASDVPCEPPSEPPLAKSDLTDPDLTDDEGPPYTKYWVHDAVIVHEETHRSDWKNFYGARLEAAIAWCELLYRDIYCPDPNTHNCEDAESFWINSIEEAFAQAFTCANADFDDPGTELDESDQRAYLAESYVNHPIADDLPEGCGP